MLAKLQHIIKQPCFKVVAEWKSHTLKIHTLGMFSVESKKACNYHAYVVVYNHPKSAFHFAHVSKRL